MRVALKYGVRICCVPIDSMQVGEARFGEGVPEEDVPVVVLEVPIEATIG